VPLTSAASESEASVIVGYLASCGIEATYDKGGMPQPFAAGGGGMGAAFGGRQEILVRAEDVDEAQRLLKDVQA
jgi:putative signal transducing protein